MLQIDVKNKMKNLVIYSENFIALIKTFQRLSSVSNFKLIFKYFKITWNNFINWLLVLTLYQIIHYANTQNTQRVSLVLSMPSALTLWHITLPLCLLSTSDWYQEYFQKHMYLSYKTYILCFRFLEAFLSFLILC